MLFRSENEGTIAYLLENCPEMELAEIPWQEGFTHGRTEKNPELSKCVRIFPHKMEGEGHFLALLKKKGAHCSLHQKTARTSGKPSKEEEKILMEFLKDVSMDWSMEQIEVRAGQVYFVPEMLQLKGRIPFLRNGLYLGEIKKNRFEPSQSFAMALKGPAMMSGSDTNPDFPAKDFLALGVPLYLYMDVSPISKLLEQILHGPLSNAQGLGKPGVPGPAVALSLGQGGQLSI